MGVFLRDVGHIAGITTSILLFMSAIFHPLSALPENSQNWMRFNPVALSVEMVRNVLYFAPPPDPVHMALFWAAALLKAWLGFTWFQRTRKGFADVL